MNLAWNFSQPSFPQRPLEPPNEFVQGFPSQFSDVPMQARASVLQIPSETSKIGQKVGINSHHRVF